MQAGINFKTSQARRNNLIVHNRVYELINSHNKTHLHYNGWSTDFLQPINELFIL